MSDILRSICTRNEPVALYTVSNTTRNPYSIMGPLETIDRYLCQFLSNASASLAYQPHYPWLFVILSTVEPPVEVVEIFSGRKVSSMLCTL